MTFATFLHGLFLLSIPWFVIDVVAHYGAKIRRRSFGTPSLRRKGDEDDGKGSSTKLTAAAGVVAARVHDTLSTSPRTSLTGPGGRRFHRGFLLSRSRYTIRLETTAFNGIPALTLRMLGVSPIRTKEDGAAHNGKRDDETYTKGHKQPQGTSLLQHVYHYGATFGSFAAVASFGFLVYNALTMVASFFTSPEADNYDGLYRRSLPDDPAVAASSRRLVPLIPGLTLPWDDCLPLGVALIAVQLIHEAGHALCAALYGIRPISMGIMLIYPAIPGAYVVLPPSTIKQDKDADDVHSADVAERGGGKAADDIAAATGRHLSTKRRIEIVMAGVWHNAITALLMSLLVALGVSSILHSHCWKNAAGLRVQSIAAESPLSHAIPAGSMITHIDEVALSNVTSQEDRLRKWNQYVKYMDAGYGRTRGLGWCVPGEVWQNATTTCCERLDEELSGSRPDQLADDLCFAESPHSIGKCVDPTPIAGDTLARCMEACSDEDDICARPDEREDLVRLSIEDGKVRRIVLFQGQGAAIVQALTVSTEDFALSPHRGLIALYSVLALIWKYTWTLSIAMTLFNLLPLPGLDGDAFLSILAAALSSDEQKRGTSSLAFNAKTLAQMQKRLHSITIALAVFVFGGSLLQHAVDA